MRQRIECFFNFHLLRRLRPLNIGGHLYECEHCKIKLCIHHGRQQCIPYDDDVKKVEEDIQKLYEVYS